MKTAISRFVVVAAIAALVGGVTPVLAQITFTDFSSVANLTPNGDAAQSGNVLRLTPAQPMQAGSAWFRTPQAVAGTFSTTFAFQLSGAPPNSGNTAFCAPSATLCPADGFAFVIQNVSASPLTAIGPDGCGMGFAGNPNCAAGPGITNSLAVEFDTFNNAATDLNSANHVAIQSCLTAANDNNVDPNNVTDTNRCSIANNAILPVTLTDGAMHTVTITYTAPPSGSGPGSLDVIVDSHDLFVGGVAFDMTTIGLSSGTAYVGFTAATGGAFENHDILSWTLTPNAQSAPVTPGGAAAVLGFNGGPANGAYEADAQLDSTGNPGAATVQYNPIPTAVGACNKLVQKKFPGTQCFVYKNAGGPGLDSALMFELTCPEGYTTAQCGNATQNFFATLGTQFNFDKGENPGFKILQATIGPYPGWLKGSGPDPMHPCAPFTGNSPGLFQSNQITSFSVIGDPLGTTKGKSGGSGSCWVATYFTFGEAPPGVSVATPAFTTYKVGQTVTANYTCSNPRTTQASNSPVGPYLTVGSCTQSQAPNPTGLSQNAGCVPGNACSGGVDTSVKGLHVFTVTSKDSGGDVGAFIVIYNVVQPK